METNETKSKLTFGQQLGRFGLAFLVIWIIAALLRQGPVANPQTTLSQFQKSGIVSNGITKNELMELGAERTQEIPENNRR